MGYRERLRSPAAAEDWGGEKAAEGEWMASMARGAARPAVEGQRVRGEP